MTINYIRATYDGAPLEAMISAAVSLNQYLRRPIQESSLADFRKSFPRSEANFTLPYCALGQLQYNVSASKTGSIGICVRNDLLRISLYDNSEPDELSEIVTGARSIIAQRFALQPDPEPVEKPVGTRRKRLWRLRR